MGNDTILHLRNIKKSFGETRVLSGIDLEIQRGEFITLLGSSGCGKTTTLRIIAGLEEITAGELYIDGKLMNDVEPKNRDIAMVRTSPSWSLTGAR